MGFESLSGSQAFPVPPSKEVKVNAQGQVTIPKDIRERAGLLPGTEVEFHFDGNTVTLIKATNCTNLSGRGKQLEKLRGKGDVKLTTDQIMALTRSD